MNNCPLVSIIMPAFNAEKFIKESIQSVIQQSYSNWELIVIDDGSSDKTAEIVVECKKKDKRIRLIQHESNKGLVITRNRGIIEATGEFIANLDSDDIATKNRLSKQIQFFKKNPDYVLLGGACITINSDGKKLDAIKRPIPNHHLNTLLLFSNYFINSTVMMEAKAAKELNYQTDYPPAEDYQFFTQLAKYGKIGNLNCTLGQYRIHDNNISQLQKGQQLLAIYKIQENQIQQLGLRPTQKELELHSNLAEEQSEKQSLKETESWLTKLSLANQLSTFYEPEILNYYCAYFYRRACQKSLIGLNAIRHFRKSKLSAYLKKDVSGNTRFYIKSILKKN